MMVLTGVFFEVRIMYESTVKQEKKSVSNGSHFVHLLSHFLQHFYNHVAYVVNESSLKLRKVHKTKRYVRVVFEAYFRTKMLSQKFDLEQTFE